MPTLSTSAPNSPMLRFRAMFLPGLRTRALLLSGLVGCGMAAGCADSTGPSLEALRKAFVGTYVLVSVSGQGLPAPYPTFVNRVVIADTLYLSSGGVHEVMVREDSSGAQDTIERVGTLRLQPAGTYDGKFQPNDWIIMDFSPPPCKDPEFCFGTISKWGINYEMWGMLDGDRFLAGGYPDDPESYDKWFVYRRLH